MSSSPYDPKKPADSIGRNAFRKAAEYLMPQGSENISYSKWCRTHLDHLFPVKFGPHHKWIFQQVQKQPHGARVFAAAPRGSGKTTATLLGLPLACIALGTHQFVVIIAVTQKEAESRLRIIRAELERNKALVEQWPRLKYVMRRGSRRERLNKDEEIQLVGGRLVALGAGARIRGLVRDNDRGAAIRPDLVLFDDLEDNEQARSKLRTDRLEEWLFADVVNLGGPQGSDELSVVGIGTTIAAGALATRAVRRVGRFSTWRTRAFPAEYLDEDGVRHASWPQGQPLSFLDELIDPNSERYVGNFTYSREFLLNPQDVVGALWSEKILENSRLADPSEVPAVEAFKRIVVAVDPSYGAKGDECGIIVAGISYNDKTFILDDRSVRGTPNVWGAEVADAFRTWKADNIIAEVNFGAEIVKQTMFLIDPSLTFKSLHASRGKQVRAEPVVNLYEQGKVIHAKLFPVLERQMVEWVPGGGMDSPDRVDALVWAVSYLALRAGGPSGTYLPTRRVPKLGPSIPLRLIPGGARVVGMR